jgi:hypothetical protein
VGTEIAWKALHASRNHGVYEQSAGLCAYRQNQVRLTNTNLKLPRNPHNKVAKFMLERNDAITRIAAIVVLHLIALFAPL